MHVRRSAPRLAAAAAFLLAIAAFAQSAPPTEDQLKAAGAVQVTGEALAALLKNQTLRHTNLQSGQEIPMYYRDDGRRFLRLGSAMRESKWWQKDDMRCEDSVVAGRGFQCQKIYKQGDDYRLCTVGEARCDWKLSFTPGDVEKLAPAK